MSYRRAASTICAAGLMIFAACKDGVAPVPVRDTVVPRVQLTAPADGVCTRAASVLLSGTASDSMGVVRVTYRIGDDAETELPIAPGAMVSFSKDVVLPPGQMAIVVTAYDGAGNSARAQATVRHSVSRLIAAHSTANPEHQLVVIDSEGECLREIAPVHTTSDRAASPSWNPSQTNLVFQTGRDPKLYILGSTGNVERLLPNSQFDSESSPQFSKDGQWIYFSAGRLSYMTGGTPSSLWRVRADGSSLQQISPDVDPYTNYDYPSPSGDGSRVVFLSDGYPYTPWIHILDVASRTVTPLNVIGESPRWSPNGDLIAYIGEGGVAVMNSSGGERRIISPPGVLYTKGLAWSHDGASVLVRNWNSTHLEAIDVASGAITAIPNSAALFNPAW